MQTFWVLDVENDGEDWTAAKPVKALSMGGAAQEFMDSELSDLAAEYEDEPTGRTDSAYMALAARELTELVLSTAPDHPLALVVASLVDGTMDTSHTKESK